ncbi:MAG: hypothetical protein ACOH2V_03480 [Candidatus Saccharimonadaceae bacterium]
MSPNVRKVILILFLISVVATVAVYFIADKDITITWIAGGIAGMFYIMYRFSK